MAFFREPMLFRTMWPNFEFSFTFGNVLDLTGEDTDLLVVSTSDDFEFEKLAGRALNLKIAEREGLAYLLKHRPGAKRLSPGDLVFVKSRVLPGLSYCFVPVFKYVSEYVHDVSPEDARTGTEAILTYLMDKSSVNQQTYSRVTMQLLGHGRLKLNDREIVRNFWKALQSRGKQSDGGQRSMLDRVELRVFSPRVVLNMLELFVEEHELLERLVDCARPSYVKGKPGPLQRAIVSNSIVSKKLFEKAGKLARGDAIVLLQGESGTGKDVLANYIHSMSPRKSHPIFPVNCSAMPDLLFESEMFGHTKQAFTGAHTDKAGYVELAGEGTLFLDEIGDLSLAAQAKMLRVLEDGTYLRVGGEEPKRMRARIVAASNKDLEVEVKAGRFREDLYYRLASVVLFVDPLRDRSDDIPELVEMFTQSICSKQHLKVKQWAPDVISLLIVYRWPGNVRELRQLVDAMIAYVDGDNISISDIREYAPQRIARFAEQNVAKPLTLGELSRERFCFEYFNTFGGKTREMARAYNVSDSAVSQQKTKHGCLSKD
jgi:DNA-binding NtrC family response regulator